MSLLPAVPRIVTSAPRFSGWSIRLSALRTAPLGSCTVAHFVQSVSLGFIEMSRLLGTVAGAVNLQEASLTEKPTSVSIHPTM